MIAEYLGGDGGRTRRRDRNFLLEGKSGAIWEPSLGEFSLIDLAVDRFRFLIVVDRLARDASVFLAYGAGLAKLFGLPERAPLWPMTECIPNRYRSLFMGGCKDAISEVAPVRFSGEMAGLGGSEFYRACFMPLKMRVDTMQALYGSFNFRLYTAADLAERSQLADAAGSLRLPELPLSVDEAN
jgi:hypothetical protein